jgi:hypothetical protein
MKVAVHAVATIERSVWEHTRDPTLPLRRARNRCRSAYHDAPHRIEDRSAWVHIVVVCTS